MRYRVWPYRGGSRSASALAAALGGRVLKRAGSTFHVRAGDVIVNWGDTDPPPFVTLNRGNVRTASNKLLFFQRMRDAGLDDLIPPFWTDADQIPDDRFPIVCRTVLAGHSGEGIVIANTRGELVRAPLFVRYMPKKEEYRVHGSPTEVIAVQRKARRLDTPDADVNWRVRNHDNGFVFAREGFVTPRDVVAAAQRCLGASGLDFGAVDVIWNEKSERAYVLEINTAPGLEGQTVEDYARFFRCNP
jgi:hypothetical protein